MSQRPRHSRRRRQFIKERQINIIMDAKSLAKSKRAHSLHHKKHNPNHKVKGGTSSVSTSGADIAVKEKPRVSRGSPALPSNWDRYEDENDPMTESQTDGQMSQLRDIRKSKGADYAYLISEAKFQSSTRLPSEIFPSLDDFLSDFGQGKDYFLAARGESLLSSIQNDSFFVDDKTPASYEASFLSLNMHALADQLAKMDLSKRLFMETDLFSLEQPSERGQECENFNHDHDNAHVNELQEYEHHDVTPKSNPNPKSVPNSSENQSKLLAEAAENELDMLLDSFADANLKEKPITSTSTSNRDIVAFDIDSTLDDLLKETSTSSLLDLNNVSLSNEVKSVSPPSQTVSKSVLHDDFESWLDTI